MKWKLPKFEMGERFKFVLGAMAMLAVALVSALLTMRLAIHGAEVEVPSLSGMTLSDASAKLEKMGLSLNLENRFYSAMIPSGRVLSQYPSAGQKVRRDWQVRVTESLGAQKVEIPNVVGKSEREATIAIRRLQLEVGTVAHIAAPGEPGIVLAQTPPPNAEGVDKPRVSLLLSEAASEDKSVSYVMPNLGGLTLGAAAAKVGAMGLKIVAAEEPAAEDGPADGTGEAAVPVLTGGGGLVTAQTPLAGHRVVAGDAVKVTLSR